MTTRVRCHSGDASIVTRGNQTPRSESLCGSVRNRSRNPRHRRRLEGARKERQRCSGEGAVPHVRGDAGGLRASDGGDRAAVALVLRVGVGEAGGQPGDAAEGAAVDAAAGGPLAAAGLVVGGHPSARHCAALPAQASVGGRDAVAARAGSGRDGDGVEGANGIDRSLLRGHGLNSETI